MKAKRRLADLCQQIGDFSAAVVLDVCVLDTRGHITGKPCSEVMISLVKKKKEGGGGNDIFSFGHSLLPNVFPFSFILHVQKHGLFCYFPHSFPENLIIRLLHLLYAMILFKISLYFADKTTYYNDTS